MTARQLPRGALCAVILLLGSAVLTDSASGQNLRWRKKREAAGLTVGINPLDPDVLLAEEPYTPGNIHVSYDAGITWSYWSNPGISALRQIFVHPVDTNIVLCASAGPDLMRSSDHGLTWDVALANFGIDGESITGDPSHPDTLFAGNFADGKVFRSTDRGTTWSAMGISSSRLCALAVRADDGNVILAGTGGGTISKSTDAGVSWRIVKEGTAGAAFQEVPRIVISEVNPDVAYATTYGTLDSTLDVWKSIDGGESWSRTALQRFPTWAMDVDPTDPDIVYVGSFTFLEASVLKTTDGGSSWISLMNGLPQNGFMWSLKVHPMDPEHPVLAVSDGYFGPEGIYRLSTSIGGVEGVLLDAVSGDTVHNGVVENLATGDISIIAAQDPLFRLGLFDSDSTTSPNIRVTSYPYLVRELPVILVPDSTVREDVQMTPLARKNLAGTIADSGSGLPVEAKVSLYVNRFIGDTVLTDSTDASGAFRFDNIYVSEAGVNSYDRLLFEPVIPYTTLTVEPLVISSDLHFTLEARKADVFIVSAFDGGGYLPYYTSALSGVGLTAGSWDQVRKGTAPMSRAGEFSRRALIYYTGDHLDSLPRGDLDSLAAALQSGAHVFITGQNVLEKNENAALFSDLIGVGFDSNSVIAYNAAIPGEIFGDLTFFTTGTTANNQVSRDRIAILDSNVHAVLDYGPHTGGVAAVRRDNVVDSSRVIVMGFGFEAIYPVERQRAVMEKVVGYLDGSIVTSAFTEEGSFHPADFRLMANYPNPFNPSTTLTYDLPRRAEVDLVVMNILGETVDRLVGGVRGPGRFTASWNAGSFPTGIYYAILRIPGEPVRALKMLLVR